MRRTTSSSGRSSLRRGNRMPVYEIKTIKHCPLCSRSDDNLQMEKHHLETRRENKENVESICRECHKQIHGLFSQREIRDPRLKLDTVEGLLENEKFNNAVSFIKKIEPGTFMKMKEAKTKRRRR